MAEPAHRVTPGAKMMFLIRRRDGTTREELIAHWFANHMPAVIESQEQARQTGHPHAHRYLATIFDPAADTTAWDGVAQLWWDQPLPKPEEPFGTRPADSFQEKARPYVPWATRELVVMDGSERLPVTPLTLNAPFPCTRSGFHKVTLLLETSPGTDHDAMFDHWLSVHAPNVRAAMEAVGGFRYVISLSLEPADEPYAGMAELYFPDASGWERLRERLEPDGLERWLAPGGITVLSAGTEMIGIP